MMHVQLDRDGYAVYRGHHRVADGFPSYDAALDWIHAQC